MTSAELAQVEAAKVALGKATPGPWEIQLFDTVAVDFLKGRAVINASEDEVFYDAVLIAAAPVLVERVIELEAEVAALKEWQREAVEGLQKYKKFIGGERMVMLSKLIAQAQGGVK